MLRFRAGFLLVRHRVGFRTKAQQIPSAVPQNGTPQVYVTTAGAPYPPGANGSVRIDFAVPRGMLQPGNASNNFQILQPSTSTPIYNVTINVPNGVVLPKAK